MGNKFFLPGGVEFGIENYCSWENKMNPGIWTYIFLLIHCAIAKVICILR